MSYIARWDVDAPFKYLSPQIEDLLGFPAERFVNEPELWVERLHPEDRERVLGRSDAATTRRGASTASTA